MFKELYKQLQEDLIMGKYKNRKLYGLRIFYKDGKQYKFLIFDDYYDLLKVCDKYVNKGYSYKIEVL